MQSSRSAKAAPGAKKNVESRQILSLNAVRRFSINDWFPDSPTLAPCIAGVDTSGTQGVLEAMKRGRGRQSLYEAMSRSRSKSSRGKMLDRFRPQLEKLAASAKEALRRPGPARPYEEATPVEPVPEQGGTRPVALPKPAPPPETPTVAERVQPWLRPKAVQYNEGRIEISVRWPVAVGAGLLVVVVLLVVYRLGYLGAKAEFGATMARESNQVVGASGSTADSGQATNSGGAGNDTAGSQAVAPTGDHVVVLAHYPTRTQLVPVQEHFRQHGVGTAIVTFERLRQYFSDRKMSTRPVPRGDGFMLITDRGYDNPATPGTDGHAVLQRIKEIGAQYQPPEGYESFAPNRFGDAYGMKLK
jgi:hypothetical protein